MARLFSRRAKANPVTPVVNHATYEYPVSPGLRGDGSCAVGVIIDGAVYALAGEPPPGRPSVQFGGNGQR